MRPALLASFVLFAGLSASGAAVARAQSPPAPTPSPTSDPCGGEARLLATLNRPTIGFSTCAVAKGTTVLELGYQNSTVTGSGAGNQVQYTQLFARIGVYDRLEFDLIAPNLNRVTAGGTRTAGYSDSGIGFKYELPPRSKFNYAIDGLFTVASGTNGFSTGAPGYTANFDTSYALSPAMAAGSTIVLQSVSGYTIGGTRSRYGNFVPSAFVSAQLPGLLQLYAEYVYSAKSAPDIGSRSTLDFGVQKLIGRRIEVDLELGTSLNTVAGSRFRYVGAGLGLQV
jgi:hypothetical protein